MKFNQLILFKTIILVFSLIFSTSLYPISADPVKNNEIVLPIGTSFQLAVYQINDGFNVFSSHPILDSSNYGNIINYTISDYFYADSILMVDLNIEEPNDNPFPYNIITAFELYSLSNILDLNLGSSEHFYPQFVIDTDWENYETKLFQDDSSIRDNVPKFESLVSNDVDHFTYQYQAEFERSESLSWILTQTSTYYKDTGIIRSYSQKIEHHNGISELMLTNIEFKLPDTSNDAIIITPLIYIIVTLIVVNKIIKRKFQSINSD